MYLAFYVEKKTINLREKTHMGEALSETDKLNKINGIFLGIAAVMNFAL